MFKKLLSNLPFNPSLITQVSFYAKRMRKESAVRRLGIVFMTLTMVIQIIAVISPAQPTLAQSDNDLIIGGFNSQDGAVSACSNNVRSYQEILQHYGITCSDVASASTVTLNSRDYDSQLYSMGWRPYGKAGETPVDINGGTLWLRFLWSWDSYASSTYHALSGTTKYGLHFFILYDCGNLVFVGLPPPPPPCPYNPDLFQGDEGCQPPRCALDQSLLATDQGCSACPYLPSITKVNPRCVQCANPRYPGYTKDNPGCKPICKYNPGLDEDSAACKPCEASQTRDDKTACLDFSKKARNVTQNIADANGTTAKAGDVIEYTLTVKNAGKAKISKYEVTENISDVLDYSDIVDLHGGTLNKNNVVTWPKTDIPANGSIQKQFSVKIKDPIPATPISASDPGHFDSKLTNWYGNTVTINVPQPPSKKIEIVTKALPNTGPGTSLLIGFSMAALFGYFFARSKLFATELDIVRLDYGTNGGQ